jgi:hypothetical protein
MNDELTTRQAAERLKKSDRLVRLWCQQGRFLGAHLVEHPRGDYWLIPERDLESFVKPKPGPVPKATKASKKGSKK